MTVLPTVRRQVQQAAAREAARGRRDVSLRGAPLPTGWLVPAGALAVAVVIAVAAIGLLGHRRPAGPGPAAAGAPGAQRLIARLAVLRRPQEAADVLPAGVHVANAPAGKIIPAYTRLVATPPGARLYLVVTRPYDHRGALWSPRLGDQVALVEVTDKGATQSAGIPAADLDDPSQESDLGYSPRYPGRFSPHELMAEVVPDGVARVRWSFAVPGPGPNYTASMQVANNVVFAGETGRGTRDAALIHVSWYTASGAPVPTSDATLRRARAAQDAPVRARSIREDRRHHYTAPPSLLARFSIFRVDSPTGVHVPGGLTLLHPSLSAVPTPVLASPVDQVQLDPFQMREVITSSGVRVFVIPGQRGMCVSYTVPSPLTGLFEGGGANCSGSLAQAESEGLSLNASDPGICTSFGVVPDGKRARAPRSVRVTDGIYAVVKPWGSSGPPACPSRPPHVPPVTPP